MWGIAGKDRDAASQDVLARIRQELGKSLEGDEALRLFARRRPAGSLAALVERMKVEREVGGRAFPGLDSTAKELHAERAMLKSILKAHTKALSETHQREPNAIDLEEAKPAFVLYQLVCARIKELDRVGAETETAKAKEAAMKEKLHDLREEAKRLKATLAKYETAFVAKHGRKMKTKVEIEPVATEYDRFKEVKTELERIQQEYAAACGS